VVGVMIAGVPVEFGSAYLSRRFERFKDEVAGQPTGRVCYDCVVPGLSKHLVLKYLLRTGALARGSAVALADSPAGNDAGLTEYHAEGIPFVSVGGAREKVPAGLGACHVGGHADGAGAFLQQLVDHWGDAAGGFHRLPGQAGHLTLATVEALATAARAALAAAPPTDVLNS